MRLDGSTAPPLALQTEQWFEGKQQLHQNIAGPETLLSTPLFCFHFTVQHYLRLGKCFKTNPKLQAAIDTFQKNANIALFSAIKCLATLKHSSNSLSGH